MVGILKQPRQTVKKYYKGATEVHIITIFDNQTALVESFSGHRFIVPMSSLQDGKSSDAMLEDIVDNGLVCGMCFQPLPIVAYLLKKNGKRVGLCSVCNKEFSESDKEWHG